MIACSSIPAPVAYAIPEKALARWASERLHRERGADGGVVYSFALSGSTCTNVPLETVMTVHLDAGGTIRAASWRPAAGDGGCERTCAAQCHGRAFLSSVASCDEALGLTLHEAAFRDWDEEPSGCFCTAANRRHKWRNVFQALHYAAAH